MIHSASGGLSEASGAGSSATLAGGVCGRLMAACKMMADSKCSLAKALAGFHEQVQLSAAMRLTDHVGTRDGQTHHGRLKRWPDKHYVLSRSRMRLSTARCLMEIQAGRPSHLVRSLPMQELPKPCCRAG